MCTNHRDAEGTPFSVRLGDIHAAQRLRVIAAPLQRVQRPFLRLGSVPEHLIHPGRVLALVLRHSSHGERFAAERVGEQMLQGARLVPSPFLRRLHDPCLEPTHVLVDGPPVDGVPAVGFVGNRTNRFSCVCRHLPCFLGRFAKLSRDARPVGSQRAFTSGMSHPVSARLPHGLRFLRPPSPAPPWVGLAAFLPADAGAIRASHVPLE